VAPIFMWTRCINHTQIYEWQITHLQSSASVVRATTSQWRSPKFDPPRPHPNPISDTHKIRQRWLRCGPLHLCKSSSRSAQGFRFRTCVTSRTERVDFYFGFLQLAIGKTPWTDFDAKYAETSGSAQGCAFSGLRTYNLIFRPPFLQISTILGQFLTRHEISG